MSDQVIDLHNPDHVAAVKSVLTWWFAEAGTEDSNAKLSVAQDACQVAWPSAHCRMVWQHVDGHILCRRFLPHADWIDSHY